MKTGAASPRSQARLSRFRSLVVSAPIIFLAAFHAAVLLRRIGDASITRPLVLGRWAFAAALLILGFAARRVLARRGGRRVAIVFWLLVAVLHLVIPAGEGYFDARDQVALLVEAGLVVVPASIVLAILLNASAITAQGGSRWISADLIAFAPARSRTCHGDRAPPRL